MSSTLSVAQHDKWRNYDKQDMDGWATVILVVGASSLSLRELLDMKLKIEAVMSMRCKLYRQHYLISPDYYRPMPRTSHHDLIYLHQLVLIHSYMFLSSYLNKCS